MVQRVIFHIDMDAFYASVEQRDHPELCGKPVIIGAMPGKRGVVCAASYEARKYGVRSAMPISRAYSLCPGGVYLRPDMRHYEKVSEQVMAILDTYSPVKEQISIDEAFLDMSGTEKLFGSPVEAAEKIQKQIARELSLSCSIGVAPNKLLAKIASDMHKPGGITAVPFDPAAIVAWLAPLAVGIIWGIGPKSVEQLHKFGIRTVGDLQQAPRDVKEKLFGRQVGQMDRLCRGIDDRCLEEVREAQSISREHTFDQDCGDDQVLRRTLLSLSRDVALRARESGLRGRTVFLTWRTTNFQRHTRQRSMPCPTNLQSEIFRTAMSLLEAERKTSGKIRLLGVGVSGFREPSCPDLFPDNTDRNGKDASEQAVAEVLRRFGRKAIFLAGELKDTRSDS